MSAPQPTSPGSTLKPRGRRLPAARLPVRRMIPVGLASEASRERSMLADYLKMLAWWLGRPPAPALPPRLEQTFRCLLRGRSEKQIARELAVSIHTVHQYVKAVYRRFDVNSRGELIARFLPTDATRSVEA